MPRHGRGDGPPLEGAPPITDADRAAVRAGTQALAETIGPAQVVDSLDRNVLAGKEAPT